LSTGRSDSEWLEIRDHRTGWVVGYVPLEAVEDLGVDTDSLDHGGVAWFTAAQAQAVHEHPQWQPLRPGETET
jgi:hypothetical protein